MYKEEPKEMTLVIHSLEEAFDEDGVQRLEDTHTYRGVCYTKNEKIYLKYDELQEQVPVTTILVVTPEEVIIRRTGGMNSRMQFRNHLTYSFLYHTMYGDVPLTITTKKFDTKIAEGEIRIDLCYDILSQDVVVSYHEIHLEATM